MSTEPRRLQDVLSQAIGQPTGPRPLIPAVRYPVHGASDAAVGGRTRRCSSAARPLFTASAAMAATAVSVAFNAPALLLASVAGIAVYAVTPLLQRFSDNPAPAQPFPAHPARKMAEKAALAQVLAGC